MSVKLATAKAEEHKGKGEGYKIRNLGIRRTYPLATGAYYSPREDEMFAHKRNTIPHLHDGVARRFFSTYHVLVLCFLLLSGFSAAGAADDTPTGDRAKKILIQRGPAQIAVFNVEVVADEETMRQGLSGRSSMPAGHGMLFILDSSTEHYFWMQGMEFPIDILFFDEDKNLTEVQPNFMPCKICLLCKAPSHTAYALEINAGLAEALGIKTGDKFVYENK